MAFFRMLSVLVLFTFLLHADVKKMLEMSEKLDKLDAHELSLFLEKADECTYRRDFYCATSYHEKAYPLATTGASKAKLRASISQLDDEKERVYREKRAKEQEEEEQREREILDQQRLAQQEEDNYNQAQNNINMSNYMMQKMNQTNPFNQQFNRPAPNVNTYNPPNNRNNDYKPQTQTTPNTQKQYPSNPSTQQTTQIQNTQKSSTSNQTSPQTTQQQFVAPSQQTFTPIIKNDVSYDYGLSYEQSQTWCKRKADELRSWNWSPHQLISIGECSCNLGKNSVANDSNMLRKEYRCELKYVWQKNSSGGSM